MSHPRRLQIWLIAVALGLAGCSVSLQPTPEQGPAPRALETLDVPEPDPIDWRRTVAGIEVLGSGTRPDPEELLVLERALEDLPDELLAAVRPRRIVRVREGSAELDTAAYTIGSDIYLIDETFAHLGNGFVTFDLVRLLAHEFAHVAQFQRLTDADVQLVADNNLDDPIPTSAFVSGFADAAGWSNRGRASGVPDWVLTNPGATTSYGATAPEEDMAETLAETVVGGAASVSSARIRWVEEWLNHDADSLSAGRPWAPAGATRIVSEEPLYDQQEVQRRTTGPTEVMSFSLPRGGGEGVALAQEIERELEGQEVTGTFARVPDDRIERYSGFFLRGDGVGYWVELWDFRNAPGYIDPPPQPVLTYVVLWR